MVQFDQTLLAPPITGIAVPDRKMDKELFQTALRVLQQVNKQQPISPADAETVRRAAPPEYGHLGIDQIAVELIQRWLKRKSTNPS
jgi:hypothetical protein